MTYCVSQKFHFELLDDFWDIGFFHKELAKIDPSFCYTHLEIAWHQGSFSF